MRANITSSSDHKYLHHLTQKVFRICHKSRHNLYARLLRSALCNRGDDVYCKKLSKAAFIKNIVVLGQFSVGINSRGIKFGRRHSLSQDQIIELRTKRCQGIKIVDLMNKYKFSKASVYRMLSET